MAFPFVSVHPSGEVALVDNNVFSEAVEVDTFAGKLHVEWDPNSAVTPMGQLPFFIQCLKLGGALIHGLRTALFIIKVTTRPKKSMFWAPCFFPFYRVTTVTLISLT